MNVQVEDSLACRTAVGLDDNEPVRIDCTFDRRGEPRCCASELLRSTPVKRPDVGDVDARDDESMSEGRRVAGKERHNMLIAIDLANIGVISLDDLAEGAVRVACKHSWPRW